MKGADFGAQVSYRWLRQIAQDLWAGGQIPRRFTDAGVPDANGNVTVTAFDVTFFDGTLLMNATLSAVVSGFTLSANIVFEVSLKINQGILTAELVSLDIDFRATWSQNGAISLMFFVAYELVGRLILRAVDETLEEWTEPLLQKWISGLGIDLRRHFSIKGTPLSVDLVPTGLEITLTTVAIDAQIDVH